MKLAWTYRAQNDLVAIGRYIARDNPSAARKWVSKLRKRARQLPATPYIGRVVPELIRHDIREVIERNYRIVYRICEKRIEILTVFEGHHLFPLNAIPPKTNETVD